MATLVQLQYAVELGKQKSFLKAAQKCFVTQPTMSMQIQKLEEEYEVTIFDRSRKPIAPTLEGSRLLEQFQRVLNEFAQIELIANESKDEVGGEYRLAMIPTIAPAILPVLLTKVRKNYPKIKISAIELPTDQIIQQLIEGSIDAGILSTPLNHPAIHETVLFHEPLHLFHSKDVTLTPQKNGRISVASLPLDKLLVLTEKNCLRHQTLDLCALKDVAKKVQGFEIEASSLLTLINLIQSGNYFTILPHLASLTLTKKQQALQLKDLAGGTPVRQVGLVTHRSQIKAPIDGIISELVMEAVPNNLLGNDLKNGRVVPPV